MLLRCQLCAAVFHLVAHAEEIVTQLLDDLGRLTGQDGRSVLPYEDGLVRLDEDDAVGLRERERESKSVSYGASGVKGGTRLLTPALP